MIEEFLKYKFSVHTPIFTKKIINKSQYFNLLLKEYNELESEESFDFWFYAKEYNLVNENEVSNTDFEIELNKMYYFDYEEKLNNGKLNTTKVKNYKNIPTIYQLDKIYNTLDNVKKNIVKDNFDIYKEVDVLIYQFKKTLPKLNNKIGYDMISMIHDDNINEYIEINEFYFNQNMYDKKITWKSFKNNLNLELSKILDFNKRELTNYTKDDLTNRIEQKIIDLTTNGDYFNQWNELFKDKSDYDNFIALFVSYSKSEVLDENLKVNCKTGTKTKLYKILRNLHLEIGINEVLKEDIIYIRFIKQINHYSKMSDDKLYKGLTSF